MPKLRCSAESCIHNNSECCCRGQIDVSGNRADKTDDTCCSSFYEDIGNSRNSLDQTPTIDMEIACQAQNCIHNDGCRCSASYVDVSGYGAQCSNDTCCSSFVPR